MIVYNNIPTLVNGQPISVSYLNTYCNGVRTVHICFMYVCTLLLLQ